VLNSLLCRHGNCWNWCSEFFSLVILSELTIKCVIGFGRYVRIVEDQSTPTHSDFQGGQHVHYFDMCKSIPFKRMLCVRVA
jgi:hypothetical protein